MSEETKTVEQRIQEEAPLATFPTQLIQIEKVTAPSAALKQVIDQYNAAAIANNWSTCATLIQNNPDLENCKITSTKFNRLIDEIKAVQIMFSDNIEEYMDLLAARTFGINDSVASTTSVYSSAKVNELLATKVDLSVYNAMIAKMNITKDITLYAKANSGAHSTGWVKGTGNVYTQTITNLSDSESGFVLAADSRPLWYLTSTPTADEYEAFCYIASMEVNADNGGTAIFTCPSGDYPTMNLGVTLKGV